jgi:CDP-paratose 2-epimerase
MSHRVYAVTGGAGFIGANYVHRLLARGERVVIFDNLSRHGAQFNVAWLQEIFGRDAFTLTVGDLRDADSVTACARDADVVVHLGGQVAVTASVQDPRADFEANALGTLNVLEAARHSGRNPIVLYASTNKVYGALEGVDLVEEATRWRYKELPGGCAESQPLNFVSPYGCSKGAGDQYVRDYARIYGLRTVVFRQSCIYGPRQFGIDGQGWLAWMMLSALEGRRITIYGDGKQTRDVLYVDDLLDAYDAAVARIDTAAGQVYNLGGGPDNVLAVWAEFGPMLETLIGRPIEPEYGPWRPGDQRVFCADVTKARRELDWAPSVRIDDGVRRLFAWVKEHQAALAWR